MNSAKVPRLDLLVVNAIATNFHEFPTIDKIPAAYVDNLVALVDTEKINFRVAVKNIVAESFWKKKAEVRWKVNVPAQHGNCWKRLYAEKHLGEAIESYFPSPGSSLNFDLLLGECLEANIWVHTLRIRQLPSHLDLSLLLQDFSSLFTLDVTFGAQKVGMDWVKSAFGMKLTDAVNFSKLLFKTQSISYLKLSENLIDDDTITVLVNGLRRNHTITHLDLSHNKIGDIGAHKLSKLIKQNSTLLHLDLSDNKISEVGATGLGMALGDNFQIQNFSCRQNPIGDSGGAQLLNGLLRNNSLTHLDIAAADLRSESGKALTKLIKSGASPLESLNVSSNLHLLRWDRESETEDELLSFIQSAGGGQAAPEKFVPHSGLAQLWQALQANSTLVSFDIRGVQIVEDPTSTVKISSEIKDMFAERMGHFKHIRRNLLEDGKWDEMN